MRRQHNKLAYWHNGNEWSCLYTKGYPTKERDECTSFVGII